jgi:hypothetical protein
MSRRQGDWVQVMSDVDIRRADSILTSFAGKVIASAENAEHQLRLLFGENLEFVVGSPWRITLKGDLLCGGGDSEAHIAKALESISGREVISASVSSSWDARVLLTDDYALEVIADSAQYETWEAHVGIGWVIFMGGQVTVFPPAPSANPA